MTEPDDPHNLARFVEAQRGVYTQALGELRAGRKRTHWMWFIFPQLDGLGSSPTARHFAIRGIDEAAAYFAHPVLGPRLVECAEALLAVPNATATEIMGTPDDLKLRSSATLFAQVAGDDSVFHRLLDRFYDSQPDRRSTVLLGN